MHLHLQRTRIKRKLIQAVHVLGWQNIYNVLIEMK